MHSSAESSVFARAARREPTEYTPVWFMRQAGRILPEYRALREKWTLLEICRQPELCAEVTLQPLRRMPLDAAVLFADIMLPLVSIGVDLELVDDVGPVIKNPIRDASGVAALRPMVPEQDVPFVLETIHLVRDELAPARAVIGFAGAPFTLASHLIEGRPTRDFAKTKALMYGAPEVWHNVRYDAERNDQASARTASVNRARDLGGRPRREPRPSSSHPVIQLRNLRRHRNQDARYRSCISM